MVSEEALKEYEKILESYRKYAESALPTISEITYAEPPPDQKPFLNVKFLTPSELKDYIIRAYEDERLRKQAMFVWGGFGIGKSTIVKETSKELARLEAIKECSKEKDRAYCEAKTVCVPPTEVVNIKEKDRYITYLSTRGVLFCGPYDAEKKEMDKVYIYYIYWNEAPDDIKKMLYEDRELRSKSFILADFRLSLIGDPAQFTGPIVPELERGLSRWFPPLLFRVLSQPETRGILFFDEFNQAMRQIMFAAYQIVLDRQIGDLAISDKVMVIAAGNPPFEVPSSPVPYPPEPLRDRFEEIYLVGRVGDWFRWALEKNIHPIILSYIADKITITHTGDVLYDPQNKGKLKPTTPRAWERASNILWVYNDVIGMYLADISKAIEAVLKDAKKIAELEETYDKYKDIIDTITKTLSCAIGENYAEDLKHYIDPFGMLITTLSNMIKQGFAVKTSEDVLKLLTEYFKNIYESKKPGVAVYFFLSLSRFIPADLFVDNIIINLTQYIREHYPDIYGTYTRDLGIAIRSITLYKPDILERLTLKKSELPSELRQLVEEELFKELYYYGF